MRLEHLVSHLLDGSQGDSDKLSELLVVIAAEALSDVVRRRPGRRFALIAKSEIPRDMRPRSYFQHKLTDFVGTLPSC